MSCLWPHLPAHCGAFVLMAPPLGSFIHGCVFSALCWKLQKQWRQRLKSGPSKMLKKMPMMTTTASDQCQQWMPHGRSKRVGVKRSQIDRDFILYKRLFRLVEPTAQSGVAIIWEFYWLRPLSSHWDSVPATFHQDHTYTPKPRLHTFAQNKPRREITTEVVACRRSRRQNYFRVGTNFTFSLDLGYNSNWIVICNPNVLTLDFLDWNSIIHIHTK